jgi:hypothetical protein
MLNAADDAEIWDALTEGQGTYEEADPTPTVNGEDLDEERYPGRLTRPD